MFRFKAARARICPTVSFEDRPLFRCEWSVSDLLDTGQPDALHVGERGTRLAALVDHC